MPALLAHKPGRLSQSRSQRQTHEHIDPNAANIDKDHVVHNIARGSEAEVPLLAASKFDWICIAAESPGFTPQMLNVADLLYKTEFELVNHMNAIMEPAGLTKVYHVSEAISRADNKLMSVAEKDALELALHMFLYRDCWGSCIGMSTAVAHLHQLDEDAHSSCTTSKLQQSVLQQCVQ
ncbi:hypothetical protein ABBQ38_002559 [Trebouxia sp. C0009 RCD-2024]